MFFLLIDVLMCLLLCLFFLMLMYIHDLILKCYYCFDDKKNENISQADDIVVEMHSCENICLSTFRKTILFLSLRALLRYQEAIRHIKMSRTFSKTSSESFLN